MPRAGDCTRLHLLGGFELTLGGCVVEVQRAGQRLLALLALSGVAVERSFASVQLWPDAGEERAQANLRSTVWRLRRGLGDVVAASKTHLQLGDGVWVDVRDGLDELQAEDPSPAVTELRFGATLLVDLLPEWYDDWLVTERERIRQLRLAGLERCGERLLAADRYAEAIQLGLRAVAMEPLRESTHRLLMRCHLAEGNLAEALRQYDHYARLLHRELGAVPSPRMQELRRIPRPRAIAAT